jgi:hypothetical protein
MNITKQFKTLKQAEQEQNRLYDKYDYVRLIRSPLFEEEGTYVWEVKKQTDLTFKTNRIK